MKKTVIYLFLNFIFIGSIYSTDIQIINNRHNFNEGSVVNFTLYAKSSIESNGRIISINNSDDSNNNPTQYNYSGSVDIFFDIKHFNSKYPSMDTIFVEIFCNGNLVFSQYVNCALNSRYIVLENITETVKISVHIRPETDNYLFVQERYWEGVEDNTDNCILYADQDPPQCNFGNNNYYFNELPQEIPLYVNDENNVNLSYLMLQYYTNTDQMNNNTPIHMKALTHGYMSFLDEIQNDEINATLKFDDECDFGDGYYNYEICLFDDVANTETFTSNIFILDRISPLVVLNNDKYLLNPDNKTFEFTVSDELSGVKEIRYEYKYNGNTVFFDSINSDVLGDVSLSFPDTLNDGEYEIHVFAIDNAGNDGDVVTGKIIYDSTAPVITFGQIDDYYNINVDIDVSAVDDLSGIVKSKYQYRTKFKDSIESEWLQCNGTILITQEGTTTIEVKATDNAGNESAVASRTVTIDRTAPEITFEDVKSPSNAASVILKVSCTDNISDVDSFLYQTMFNKNDWSGWQDCSGDVYITSEGTTTVRVKATDNAGNESEIVEQSIVIDRTKPVITLEDITSPSNANSISLSVSCTDSLSDITSFLYCTQLDNEDVSNWKPCGENIIITKQGTTVIQVKAVDEAGNSTEVSRTLVIDRTAPTVTITGEFISNAQSVTLQVGTKDNYSDFDEMTIMYRTTFNDEAESDWASCDGNIIISREGTTIVEVSATDRAGNNTIESKSILIDRTVPVVDTITVTSNGVEYSDGSFIPAGEYSIDIDMQGDTDEVLQYQYKVSTSATAEIDSNAIPVETDTFDCKIEGNGQVYLHVWITDQANNTTHRYLSFRVDNDTPLRPYIASTTHRRATDLSKATMSGNASFTIESGGSGGTGIAALSWDLKVGAMASNAVAVQLNDIVQSGSISGKTETTVLFSNLLDNADGEYYFFMANVLGNNGNTSEQAVYPFRVDCEPPFGLYLDVSPQVNEEDWYNKKTARIMWSAPYDASGVDEVYYYAISTSNDVDIENYTEWSSTTENELTIDLEEILQEGFGEVIFTLVTSDVVGNYLDNSISIQSDWIAPQVTAINANSDTKIEAMQNTQNGQWEINWGAVEDTGCGIARLVMELTKLDKPDWKWTKEFELEDGDWPSSWVLGTLEDCQYVATLSVYDRADNITSLRCGFPEALVDMEIPYEEAIDGLTLSGIQIVGTNETSYKEMSFIIPQSLGIFKLENSGNGIIRNPVSTVYASSSDDGFVVEESIVTAIRSDVAEEYIYEVTISGYQFRSKGIQFDRTKGIVLLEPQYLRDSRITNEYDVIIDDPNYINLTELALGFPDLPEVSGTGVFENDYQFIARVTKDDGILEDAYSVVGGTSINLSRTYETIAANNPSQLTFDASVFAEDFVLYRTGTPDQTTRDSRLPLDNMRMIPGGIDAQGNLLINANSGITLEMGGNTYRILEAQIKGALLVIKSAELDIVYGDKLETLHLGGFYLDLLERKCVATALFKSDPISIIGPNGETITLDLLSLADDGTISTSGTITDSNGLNYEYSDSTISEGSVDWDEGVLIEPFFCNVYGYTVTIRSVRYTAGGLYLVDADLVYKSDITIPVDSLILQRPISTGQNQFVVKYDWYAPGDVEFSQQLLWGSVDISNLILASGEEGYLGATVSVPVDSEYFGVDILDFPNTILHSNGDIQSQIAHHLFNIGTFSCNGYGLSFDGQFIDVKTLTISLPAVFNKPQGEFSGTRFSHDGLIGTPKSDNAWQCTLDEWILELEELVADDNGVGGVAKAGVEATIGIESTIIFPDFRVNGTGVVTSGLANSDTTLIVHQCPIKVSNTELVKSQDSYVLKAGNAIFNLENIEEVSFAFGELKIASDGSVLSCDTGTETVSFVSKNGYALVANSYTIGDYGIYLGGSMRPDANWWPSAINLGEESIQIFANGSVNALDTYVSNEDNISFTSNGWTVACESVLFGYDTVSVDTCNVVYSVSSISCDIGIGELVYKIDGSLLSGSVDTTSNTLGIFGGRFETVETRFDERGLHVAAYVSLPEDLGGFGLFFNRITLYQDGTFSAETMIDNFYFEVKDFSFSCENLWLSTEGIKIGYAEINLPESLQSTQVRLEGLTLLTSGEFSLDDASIDPFTIWDMTFALETLSIQNGEVNFGGYVRLPPLEQLGPLAGRKVAIKDFSVLTNGTVQSFTVTIEGDYTIPFAEAWKVRISDVGVSYAKNTPWLNIASGSLIFPPEYPISDATIEDVSLNLTTGKFKFKDATANMDECHLEKWGMDFRLDSITLVTEEIENPGEIEKETVLKAIGLKGSVYFNENIDPPFLSRQTIVVEQFQIALDGSLFGDILITANDLEGAISKEITALELKSGSVKFEKNDDDGMVLALAGTLQFTDAAPEGMEGLEASLQGDPNAQSELLKEYGFAFDFTQSKLLALNASVNKPGITPVLGVELQNLVASIKWDSTTQIGDIGFGGGLLLPANMPEGLAGQAATIDKFTVTTKAEIKEFKASFETAENVPMDAIGGMQFVNASLNAEYKPATNWSFGIGTTLRLPADRFPEGIGGTECAANLIYNLTDGLVSITANLTLPASIDLMGAFTLNNGTLSFYNSGSSAVLIKVAGTIVLPSSFPQGLSGLGIGGFVEFDTNGSLYNLSIATSGINVDLFGGNCKVVNGSLAAAKGTGADEIVFDISGGIKLTAAALPDEVKAATFVIDPLKVSTTRGLVDFGARLQSDTPVRFPLIAGINASINNLELNASWFAVSASVTLPDTYPELLAGMTVALSTLKMGWDGSIVEVSGGIASLTGKIAGFDASIKNFLISPSAVTIESILITMPQNFGSMGGETVGMTNASFDINTGAFNAQFTIPTIQAEMAGFTIILTQPSLDINNFRLAFAKSQIKLPEFTGGSTIDLNGLTVSGNGVSISGGGFRMPDFTMAGGLGFSNVYIDFSIYEAPNEDGEYFSLAGGAQMTVPGLGAMAAQISFTNICELYPIGLKRAYFSFYASGAGLPLGTTPLALNGIRGGIAFGRPQPGEMPETLERFFDEGIRLQIGLRVVDITTVGNVLTADGDVWVDVTDWDWAFGLDMTVLKGTFNLNANVEASLTKLGFYTGFSFRLTFVKGRVEMLIFKKNNKTMLAGSGSMSFGIGRGSIINTEILFVPVCLPPSDLWLPVNAEFGNFTNGSTGFKGFVDVPVFGRAGVFVGSSGLSFNISSLTLESPATSTNASRTASFAARNFNSSIRVDDTRTYSASTNSQYNFKVPGVALPAQKTSSSVNSGVMANRVYSSNTAVPTAATAPKYERVIFAFAYTGGDPLITVTAPESGKQYHPGDEGVETVYTENSIIFAVSSMEVGQWSVSVEGIPSDSFGIEGFVKESSPDISINDPEYKGIVADATFNVNGKVNRTTGSVAIFAMLAEQEIGVEIGSTDVNSDGSYSANVSIETLPDGEYSLYAEYVSGSEYPDVRAVAPGSILVDRSNQELLAPSSLIAAEAAPGAVTLMWDDDNGLLSNGYILDITKTNVDAEGNASVATSSLFVGDIKEMTLAGYDIGEECTYAVRAKDYLGNTSLPSNPVTITFGKIMPSMNLPEIALDTISVDVEIGGVASFEIPVHFANYREVSDAARYVVLDVESFNDGNDNVDVALERVIVMPSDKMEATEEDEVYTVNVALPVDLPAGVYTFPCSIRNMSNTGEEDQFSLLVNAVYPQMRADRCEPDNWNNKYAQELTLFGNGFLPGTTVRIGDTELHIQDLNYGALSVSVPAGVAVETASGDSLEAEGNTSIVVTGPGGSKIVFPVSVISPDWSGVLHTEYVEVQAGTDAIFLLTINGKNDYDNPVVFEASKLPESWIGEQSIIRPDETGALVIKVPASAEPGLYEVTFTGSGNKSFPVRIHVVEGQPNPTISGLSTWNGYTGQEIAIFGYSFGVDGTVKLGTEICTAVSWDDSRVAFIVPDDAVSGVLTIERDGIVSNGVNFTVRERGFSIRSTNKYLDIQPGETLETEVAVTGYADTVYIESGVSDSDMIQVVPDTIAVIPNAVVKLTVTVDEGTPAGEYPLVTSGKSRGYEADSTIIVRVGGAFAITTGALAETGTWSLFGLQLETEYGYGTVVWSLSGGRLPSGMDLSRTGYLSGRPGQEGSASFTVTATDQKGRSASKEFTLVVSESSWGQAAADSGNSRYMAGKSPADARLLWSNSVSGRPNQIITSPSMIWVRYEDEADGGVTGISRDGTVRYKLSGAPLWMSYTNKTLFILQENKELSAIDPYTGLGLWTLADVVDAFGNAGSIVVALSDGSTRSVDPASGLYVDTANTLSLNMAKTLSVRGLLYTWDETRLASVDGKKRYSAPREILAVSGDPNGFAVYDASGILHLLDEELVEYGSARIREEGIVLTGAELTITDESVLVADTLGTLELTRDALSIVWSVNSTYPIAAADGRAFASITGDSPALQAINRYNGETVWSYDGAVSALALSGERLYAAMADGSILCFNGPDNVVAPVTSIKVLPAVPDGETGWYTSTPAVSAGSKDLDGYVAEIFERSNSGDWISYTGPRVLDDGITKWDVYGVDQTGWRGESATALFQVDTVPPSTTLSVDGLLSQTGWYVSSVSLSMDALDATSGVARIEIDGKADYSAPLAFERGSHTIRYRAVDIAGNAEEWQEFSFKIDSVSPVVEVKTKTDRGLALVIVTALDHDGFVDRIEYILDGGEIMQYEKPLALTEPGIHRVSCRAIDKAGNTSDWINTNAWVRKLQQDKGWAAFASINGREVDIVRLSGPPRPYYRGSRWPDPFRHRDYESRFPRWLTRGDFIPCAREDRGSQGLPFMEFWLKQDAVTYVLSTQSNPVEGWFQVETEVPVDRKAFPEGATLYMKRGVKGAQVMVPGDFALDAAPLVIVDGNPHVRGEISLDGSWGRFFAYEGQSVSLDYRFYTAGPERRDFYTAHWTYRKEGEREWTPLESAILNIPANMAGKRMELRLVLEAPDGWKACEDINPLVILPRFSWRKGSGSTKGQLDKREHHYDYSGNW